MTIDFDVDSNIWDCLETILERPAFENVNSPINHPVLGTDRQLNMLVFETSRMAFRTFMGSYDAVETCRLDNQLKFWEHQEQYGTFDGGTFTKLDPYAGIRQLHIICVRILTLWSMMTLDWIETAFFESQIQHQVVRAMAILGDIARTTSDMWNFSMRWPLLILGFVSNSWEYREVIQLYLERIWQTSLWGDVRRTLERMQYTWKQAKDQSAVLMLRHIFLRVHDLEK